MPRPARLHVEGALYFVQAQAGPVSPLFRDSRDVDTYLDLLAQYQGQHRFKLYAYALWADRLQLCLEVAASAPLSRVMHDLNSRYTKLYSSRHRHEGPLFLGRYRAVVLEKETYLLRITRYLHAQPGSLANSLSHYRALELSWVDTQEVLGRLPTEDPRSAYEEFISTATPEELEQVRQNLRQPVVGSPDFQQRIAAGVSPAAAAEKKPAPVPVGLRPRGFLPAAAAFALLSAWMGTSMVGGPAAAGKVSGNQAIEVVVQAPASSAAAGSVQPASTPVPGSVSTAQLSGGVPFVNVLQDTVWDLQVRPGWASGEIRKDNLRFESRRMESAELTAQGFTGSNYTLTPQEDGTVLWETMQTGPNGETVCWRGEWNGRTMRGMMTRQLPNGETYSFNFVGFLAGTMSEA